jgi:hypothetical protein
VGEAGGPPRDVGGEHDGHGAAQALEGAHDLPSQLGPGPQGTVAVGLVAWLREKASASACRRTSASLHVETLGGTRTPAARSAA